MKKLIGFTLEVIIACFIMSAVIVFVDNRNVKKDIELLEYCDSLILGKMKEIIDEHNNLVENVYTNDSLILSLIK